MTPVKTGRWHEWKWNYMLFYDLWVSDIVDLQKMSEPLSHKGMPIDVTMHDKWNQSILWIKGTLTCPSIVKWFLELSMKSDGH